MTKIFKPWIGQEMEVYVDDMIVKSKIAADHFSDLTEAFGRLRFFHMKLYPQKSMFGAISRKLFVSRRGVEANSEKIRAVLEIKPPSPVKDV